ncbi:MAG: MFS transporter [Bacteroidales bacterium]|jgi:MFS family permease|nr:MFS transporter [Bacteroidales bacterium]
MLSLKIFFRERKFFAPAFLYACFALVFSTWIIYIPHLAAKLQISEGQIGTALFFSSVGSFVMIPLANRLIDILGVGRQAFVGFILYAFSLYGIMLAPSYLWLIAALFCYGMMSSIFSIAVNSLIAEIEKRAGKYIMTGSHGFWSIGGIIGASVGGYIAGKFGMPLLHVTVLLLIILPIHFWLRKEYVHIKGEAREEGEKRTTPWRPLMAVAVIGMIMMASEGAIADWSGLYLKKVVMIKPQYLGMGYAFFAVGMTIGRFNGDGLSLRFGSWKLLLIAIGVSLAGLLLVLTTHFIAAFAGFVVIGLGFSVIVPEIYRLVSNMPGVRASDGISLIAASSNVGFLTGPVVLGFVAEIYSLFVSFIVLTAFVSIAFIIALIKRE